MKILVTGTAGFIGYHLAQSLNNHDIYCIDGMVGQHPIYMDRVLDLKEKGIETDTLDLKDNGIYSLLRRHKFDLIIHLAAKAGVRESIENPQTYIDNNVMAFKNLLEAMKETGHKKLIYASSSSVYGEQNTAPFCEYDDCEHPESFYASTKRMNEMMAFTYNKLYGIESIGLRFFTVYGEWGRPDMAPWIFSEKIINDKPIQVFNNGDQLRDFTYVGDIVQGINAIVDKGFNGCDVYNIGSGNPIKLMDFIQDLESIIGKEANKEFLPKQKGDVVQTHCSVSKLKKDFDYEPNTPLNVGLSKFVIWFKQYIKQD